MQTSLTLVVASMLLPASTAAQDTRKAPEQESRQDAAASLRLVPPMDLPGDDVSVVLVPSSGRGGPRVSPKGAKVALRPSGGGDGLEGSFSIGPDGNPPIRVALSRSSADVWSHDELMIDIDRDGQLGPDERLDTRPELRRDSVWSSWSATISVQVEGPDGAARRVPYPINLWFVIDPAEPDEAPVLRWSRRGWMQGQAEAEEGSFLVALSELVMDGVYDERDWWFVAEAPEGLRAADPHLCDDHNWVGERAWRLVSLHPSGLRATLRRFDPGHSRAEEQQLRDRFAADRAAPRAASPLAFGEDFEAAESAARGEGRPLFVDFETTWCGPCKTMNAYVYTARAVVATARASRIVAVKVDGDERRDLVERFGVEAYPTMVLLGPNGAELRRAVGYRSVAQMREFLTAGETVAADDAEVGTRPASSSIVDPRELKNQIRLARREGDLAKARALVDRLLALEPDDAEAWIRLGQIQQEEGATDLALATYRRAEALGGPMESQALVSQAMVFVGQQRHGEAREVLRRALRVKDSEDLVALLASVEHALAPTVLPIGEADVEPKATHRPRPALTEAQRERTPVFVRVAFVVETDGSVRDAWVQQTTDEALDRAVLEAVQAWKFEPATKDGDAVAVRMRAPLRIVGQGER